MIRLKRPEDCCGCHACETVCPKNCIKMQEDDEGFLYPKTDASTCIDCHLCEKVCPMINRVERPKRFPSGRNEPIVFAAKNRDEEIRFQSSSGGVFSALAEVVVRNGGVVFGARWNANFTEVVHDFTETLDGIAVFRGSKYLQSRVGDAFRKAREFLRAGREVMFTGTPCQIAGLRRVLRRDFPKLLAVEVVCHGVPSPKIWNIYLRDLKRKLENGIKGEGDGKNSATLASLASDQWHSEDFVEIRSLSLRCKSPPGGWKKYSLALTWSPRSGEKIQPRAFWEPCHYWAENTYMNAFLSDLDNRPSCAKCPAKFQKSGADLTLGDFWGIDAELDDDRGCSLVLANTERGLSVIRATESVEMVPKTYAQARGIRSLEESLIPHPKRRAFFEAIRRGVPLDAAVGKYRPLPILTRIRRNGKRVCFSVCVRVLHTFRLLKIVKKILGKDKRK